MEDLINKSNNEILLEIKQLQVSHEALKTKMLRDFDAKSLLNFIEESGMAPPSVPTLTCGNLVMRSENKWESDT